MTLSVLAATDPNGMQSGYSRCRGVSGVGSHINYESLHVEISHCIEYACGVKSETIILDWRVDVRCARISLLSDEILSCVVRVSLEYASHIV
jgi:hypothetical protein